jgi:hypothetical protein
MIDKTIIPPFAAACLMLGACQDTGRTSPAADHDTKVAVADVPVQPTASSLPAVAPNPGRKPGAVLPPAGADPRFVGAWAADASMCTDKAWHFTETGLETPAGSVCHFNRVTKISGGYDIAARCTAEGPEQDDLIKIRFAESAKAMLFDSASIADTGLIYCGPPD